MRPLILIFIFLVIVGCKKDDDTNDNCNFLSDFGINRTISLSLPQYSQLAFSTNSVYIANEGNAGIYVTNVGGNFRAYDAADPNHTPDVCSIMTLEGTIVTCSCQDANRYNLLTGFADGAQLTCALKEYRVTVNGADITITN